jgi:predicted enzyme related to lactoylglutathione lyase
MNPLRQRNLTFDCADPAALARFWGEALHLPVEVRNEDAFVVPEGWEPDGSAGPRLLFQRVPESKTTKNRLHLDLTADDMGAEVRRLEGLGGRRLRSVREGGLSWTVMGDPEGNEFCVLQSPD